jgi:ADP-ribose pyrophosphatase YjhB (NUDIX family)
VAKTKILNEKQTIVKHNPRRELIARGVFLRDGCVLVNRSRNKKSGALYCALPGGHVDPGESCMEALEREIAEELGARCTVRDLLFVTEGVYAGRKKADTQRHEIVMYFAAEFTQPPREENGKIFSPEKSKNFGWLPLCEMDDKNLLPHLAREPLRKIAETGTQDAAPRYSFHDATA